MTHGTMHTIRGTGGNPAIHGGDDAGASRADGAGADSAQLGGRGAIGAYLRLSRETAGLTRRQLSERAGITTDIIISWENNVNRPTRQRFEALCNVLRVSPYPWAESLRNSYGTDSFAEYRQKRTELADELRMARRAAGITPAQLRVHGVSPQRLTKIECALSWPTETEVEAMRECYRRRDLAPGYKRVEPKMHERARAGQRRLPLTPDEKRAAVKGGEYMRRHRLASRMTIRAASKAVGVVHSVYEHWEHGKARPTSENLERAASVLGFTVADYHRAAGTPQRSAEDYAAALSADDRTATAPVFPVKRGSVWSRNGRTVVVEFDADFGDRVRYRPQGDGEMMVTSWQTFMARYAEVGA
jgi:transcriptional regulator with XRE-family HTH domain